MAPLVGLGGEDTALALGLVVLAASLLGLAVFWLLIVQTLRQRRVAI